MSKKHLVMVLIIAVVSTAFFGCDEINAMLDTALMKTTEVEADDLAEYTGTAASSEADVDAGLSLFFTGLDDAGDIMSRSVLGDDYEDAVKVLGYTAPAVTAFMGSDAPESRTASVGVSASIADEEVTDGDMTVTITKFDFTADAEADSMSEPTHVDAKFTADAELQFEDIDVLEYSYTTYQDELVATLDDIRFNMKGRGNAAVDLDTYGDPEAIDYYTGADLSLGFTISCPAGSPYSCSGRYIINLNYIQSAVLTADDINNGNFTAEEDYTITVTVYDNNGSEIQSVEYTSEELMSL